MASSSSPITVCEAKERILSGVERKESEQVCLEEALGRVAAKPLSAKITQPPFDASAMDGYTVVQSDLASCPVTLDVIGSSAAGHGFEGVVSAGQAVRIFTGAPVPSGADAIIIQENVRVLDGAQSAIEISNGSFDPSHIRPRGGDFCSGDVLIDTGETLGARHITLAAGMGFGDLPVSKEPVVAILSTGDELVSPGTKPGDNQIIASNAVGIATIVKACGGRPQLLGIANDTRRSLEEKIQLARDADVLVTIGGASVGDHDLVGPVLKDAGMELDFWKIAMRPGKPLLFGRLGSQRVIGVPGNPVSALICARIFLVPLVRALLGARTSHAGEFSVARLSGDLPANGVREHYMRARTQRDEDGQLSVEALPNQDSSLMSPLVRSDCLIVRDVGAPAASSGENVTILPLGF